jgi:hypothetical protein
MIVFHRNSRVEAAPFESDAILFNPDTKQFVKLNPTTALIWHRLDGGATVEDIAATLCERFRGVQPDQAKEDTNAALHEMVRLGLVEPL